MHRRAIVGLLFAVLLLSAGCAELGEIAENQAGFDPGAEGIEGADHEVTIVGVIDGDTVEIQYANGTVETARLIGVDTPETHVPVDPPEFGVANTTAGRECLRAAGHDATRFSSQRLLGEHVGVSFDPNLDRRGYYGRLLVYVVTQNGTHNYDLITEGHARVYESDFSNRERYDGAAEQARAAGIGVWRCATDGDVPTPTPGDPVADGGSVVDGPIQVVDVTADPDGPDGEVLNDETVTFENAGNESVSLDGWTITDEADHAYRFEALTLEPGDQVTIHTGSGTDTERDRYWGERAPIWNNDGDTVFVRRADGTLVIEYPY